MKIESIEAIALEMPLKKVLSGSFYPVTSRNTNRHPDPRRGRAL